MAELNDYWFSFVIRQERSRDGREYGDRYAALTEAIEEVAFLQWKETTSFYLVRTSLTIDEYAAHIKPAIDVSKDTVLIRGLGTATARIVGVFYDAKLNEFLPYLKRG